ncbi:MAG: type II toxin-antitoxin system RelE/ParE family toxin [Planctomycetia bacterium]|nr:type II toxin-antitoxin system RelE/ParE family toxin [Planctomycetia bacterium]
MSYEIEFYKRANGREPVTEFLDELNRKNRRLLQRIYQDIKMLSDEGPDLSMPHTRYMQDGIFELRSRESSNISRIFYFFFFGDKIIMTHGFVKKTQHTPPGELEKAIRYKKDYEETHDDI